MASLVAQSVLRLPAVPDGGGAGFEATSLLGYCWPTHGGVWALIPHGIQGMSQREVNGRSQPVFVGGDDTAIRRQRLAPSAAAGVDASVMTVDGQLQLVFVREDESLVRGPDVPYHADMVVATFYGAMPLTAAVDEPRLALFCSNGYHNTPRRAGTPYALRGQRIVPLALPARVKTIVEAGDVDRDGIDDLFVDAPFAAALCSVGCDSHTSMNGPWLLLHGTSNGGYSLEDEAALEWARQQCPRLPDDDIAAFNPYDGHEFWPWIRCKRLWGASTKSIEAVIDGYCARWRDDPQPVACKTLRADWRAWARANPPFVLR
jgi:hypothetical protein